MSITYISTLAARTATLVDYEQGGKFLLQSKNISACLHEGVRISYGMDDDI
jgi:hypothetical protein